MSRADAASAFGEQFGEEHLLASLLESSNDMVWCTSVDGEQLLVGVWDTNEMHTRMQPFPRNELMCILEGTVTVSSGDGSAQDFGPGDAFMVAKGAEYQWDCDGFVKKVYCMFIPK